MRSIQSIFFVSIFFIFSLFSQSACYAGSGFPWTMFLPAIISGGAGGTCGADMLVAGRYLVNNCETAKDTGTGLEWQRCSVGQTWNAATKSCDGSSTPFSNWSSAMALPVSDGWRVPTITELRSLVYCSNYAGGYASIGTSPDFVACGDLGTYEAPTLVAEVFPNVYWENSTLASHFWTSTVSDTDPDSARGCSFNNGKVGAGPKTTPGFRLRLVRTAASSKNAVWTVKTIDYETHHTSTNPVEGVYMEGQTSKQAWKSSSWPTASNGAYRYLSTVVDSARHGIAFWFVKIPQAGFYKLETSYWPSKNRTTDADYAVYVNTTPAAIEDDTAKPVYTKIINQNSGSGITWFSLGTYCLQKDDISMMVEDGRDDTGSDAVDASRWTFVGTEYNSQKCAVGAN